MDTRSAKQQRAEGGHAITLTTPSGLMLIPPSPQYDEPIASLRSHPGSRRYLPCWPDEFSIESIRKRREVRARDESVVDFNIFLCDGFDKTTPKFIGIAGLFNIDALNETCSVGVLIQPDYFRKGIATQVLYTIMKFAFEDNSLHMHRAVYETAENNVQMRGWLENVVGAQLEFRWREAWKIAAEPGKRMDVVGYSVLKHEWDSSVKFRLETRMKGQQP